MSQESKSLTDEEISQEYIERYKQAKTALDKLNSAGLTRRTTDTVMEAANGLGSGWAKTLTNMTATGLVGLLLYLAQTEGFRILRGLMDELREQRIANSASIEALRKERVEDRASSQRHADDAVQAIKDLSKQIRQHMKSEGPMDDGAHPLAKGK